MNIIYAIESKLWIVFTICYAYQIFYMVYMLLFRRNLSERFINRDPVLHKMAVVISARNEESVSASLSKAYTTRPIPPSLYAYTSARTTVRTTRRRSRVTRAPSCSNGRTETLWARAMRLTICSKRSSRRTTTIRISIVFDADNLLDKNYIAEMNKDLRAGVRRDNKLPQLKELRDQLDIRRIFALVPARGEIPQQRAAGAKHLLRHIGHGLPALTQARHRKRRLEAPSSHGGRGIFGGFGDKGQKIGYAQPPCCMTSSR